MMMVITCETFAAILNEEEDFTLKSLLQEELKMKPAAQDNCG